MIYLTSNAIFLLQPSVFKKLADPGIDIVLNTFKSIMAAYKREKNIYLIGNQRLFFKLKKIPVEVINDNVI